jgi:hypothetical protein
MLHRRIVDLLPDFAPSHIRYPLWRLSGLIPASLRNKKDIPEFILSEMAQLSKIDAGLDPQLFWDDATMQVSPNHLVLEGEIYYKLTRRLSTQREGADLVFSDGSDAADDNRLIIQDSVDGIEFRSTDCSIKVPKSLAMTFDPDAIAVRLLAQGKLRSVMPGSPRGVNFVARFGDLARKMDVQILAAGELTWTEGDGTQ